MLALPLFSSPCSRSLATALTGLLSSLVAQWGYYMEFTMGFRMETLLGQVQVKSTAGGLFDEMSYLVKVRKKTKLPTLYSLSSSIREKIF